MLVCCGVSRRPHDPLPWLSLCSVDSGEVLFLSVRVVVTKPLRVFAEAAESFVDDAASNPHPNVLFNAGLAWAQAGTGLKRSKCCITPSLEGPPRSSAHTSVGWNRMAQTPFGHRCPGLHLSLNSGCDGHIVARGGLWRTRDCPLRVFFGDCDDLISRV